MNDMNLNQSMQMPNAKQEPILFPTDSGINVNPASVVGAITGAYLLSKTVKKKQMENALAPTKPKPSVEGNYYKQVKSVQDNLHVVFTPMSVVYVVKNGNADFTLDTIETSEMNKDMKMAWQAKDEGYFKGLMMSKMYSEMQLAEQGFARKFLSSQRNLMSNLGKEASESYEDNDESDIDVIASCHDSSLIYKNKNEEIVKVASDLILNSIDKDGDSVTISTKLERPLTKYAGVFSNVKDCLGLHSDTANINTVKKHLADSDYVMRNVKVGFMPDRVIFTIDNQLVSTLPITNMNTDGYDHFQNNNSKYFKQVFVDQIKKNEFKKSAYESESFEGDLYKTASDDDIRNIFYLSEIHPVVYYIVLNNKYGLQWMEFDIDALLIMIQKDFQLTEEIGDIAMDKILAIHTLNNSERCYKLAFVFEKIVLSLTDKPVNFLEKEDSKLSMDDIVYAIDVMDRVTPLDDIYDNFSSEVLTYICNILANNEIYCYNPSNIISSPTEPAFTELVNDSLIGIIKNKMSSSAVNQNEVAAVNDRIDYIFSMSLAMLNSIKRISLDSLNKKTVIDGLMNKLNIREDCQRIINDQILINLSVDDILKLKNEALKTQLEVYNISRPAEEGVVE